MTQPPTPRARLAALRRLAVVLSILSFGTGIAHAEPAPPPTSSERDLAYDIGVQAEAAGDLPRAASAFERAYRLTAPAETGPRLLFLRASVAARLLADDGTPTTRVHLCHAQALLRDYLRDTTTITEEHADLGRIDQRLSLAAGPDCQTLLNPVPEPPAATPVPPPRITTPANPATTPPPAGQPQPPPARRTPGQRALLSGGVIGLALGAGAFTMMGVGLDRAQQAKADGLKTCHASPQACTGVDPTVLAFRERGELGNTLTRIGAVVGGLAVLTGVVLIVVGERLHRRPRVAHTPRLVPSGLGLAARF